MLNRITVLLFTIFCFKLVVGSALASERISNSYFRIIKKAKRASISINEKQLVLNTIKLTGIQILEELTKKQLKNINLPESQFILAKRVYIAGDYKRSLKLLDKIPENSKLYPEVLMLRGANFINLDEFNSSINNFRSCSVLSEINISSYSDKKIQLYYLTLKDICILNIARTYYQTKDYNKSLQFYLKIGKNSLQWPFALIEKAWIYYELKNYNRSLGVLLTYNSPLLQSYFHPEAEVLRALNYDKLCLYDDALEVVNKYYQVYKPRSTDLKNILESNKKKPLSFYNLINQSLKQSDKSNSFIRNVVIRIKKTLRYNFDLNSLNKLADLDQSKSVSKLSAGIKNQIDYFTKRKMYQYINKIHKISYDMFMIKLDIIEKKKNLIYRHKKQITKRTRGSLENVHTTSEDYFWTFNNEFWADELGDYSLGLKSKCETRRI